MEVGMGRGGECREPEVGSPLTQPRWRMGRQGMSKDWEGKAAGFCGGIELGQCSVQCGVGLCEVGSEVVGR